MAEQGPEEEELGWSDADYMMTVAKHQGLGANADIPGPTRFVAGIANLIRKRRANLEAMDLPDENGIAIFLLSPAPGDCGEQFARVPMFDNGLTSVAGRVWLLSEEVVAGFYLEFDESSDEDAFQLVCDDLNYGDLPAVVLDWRTPVLEVRHYRFGLGRPEDVTITPIEGEVTSEAVKAAIDNACEQCFVTPSAAAPGLTLWADPRRHMPYSSAEHQIQSQLKATLVGSFPYCRVRHEQPQVSGRTDLEIEVHDAVDKSVVTRYGILELKVLRSYTQGGEAVSDSKARNSVGEGVRQAHSYQQEKNARWAAVCCFDMRKNVDDQPDCFAHVKAEARQNAINLWRWMLFASASEYRTYLQNNGLVLPEHQ